jgi:signal transduction histidine kinase
MVDALETRIQRDARFASSVSHELRSPLTTLATASELLEKQRVDFPERMRPAVDALASDVKRFQRLVQELLELSRAEADVDAATEEPVRLAELARHHQSASDGSGFAVQIAPDVSDAALLTDKLRLDRVVTNLVENARTHGGGVTALTVDRKGNRVQICVDDSGPGIPAAERERIFERFYRGAVSGRRGSGSGTGLGLALVAEHIRVLGGEVRVDEAPHGGARFIVELPWKPA